MQLITLCKEGRVGSFLLLSGFLPSKKTLLIMKFLAFFQLAVCLQLSASGVAQGITLTEKNVPLHKVFASIEKQTGYSFWYQVELVNKARKVNVRLQDATLEQALEACFRDQSLNSK